MSKCLSGNTILETNYGLRSIKEIQPEEYVNSPNGFVRVKRVVVYGVRNMYDCTFNGYNLAPVTITKDQTIFDAMEAADKLAFPGKPRTVSHRMINFPLEFNYVVRCELDTRFLTDTNELVCMEDFMRPNNTKFPNFQCRYGNNKVKLSSITDVGAEQSYGLVVDYSPQIFYINNMVVGE